MLAHLYAGACRLLELHSELHFEEPEYINEAAQDSDYIENLQAWFDEDLPRQMTDLRIDPSILEKSGVWRLFALLLLKGVPEEDWESQGQS